MVVGLVRWRVVGGEGALQKRALTWWERTGASARRMPGVRGGPEPRDYFRNSAM